MHQDCLLNPRNFVFYPFFTHFSPFFAHFQRLDARNPENTTRSPGENGKKSRKIGEDGGNSWLGRTWQVTDFLQRVLVAVAKQRPQRPLQFAAAAFLKRAKLVDPVLACEKPEPTTGRGASVFPVQPLASLCRTRIYIMTRARHAGI